MTIYDLNVVISLINLVLIAIDFGYKIGRKNSHK